MRLRNLDPSQFVFLPLSHSRIQRLACFAYLACATVFSSLNARAVQAATTVCPRPFPGSLVEEPADLRSVNGVLETTLTMQNSVRPDGSVRYCFSDDEGHQSPNLRVHPGDLVILHLNNESHRAQSWRKFNFAGTCPHPSKEW